MQSTVEFLFNLGKSETAVGDNALLRNVKQSSEPSFSQVYNCHVQLLYNYGMQACNDHELVKHCLQELFVGVRDQYDALGVATSAKVYFLRSFRKLLIEKIHARKKFPVRVTDVFQTQFEFGQIEPKIQGLRGPQREAVFLKFNNKLSYHEVAFVMDLKVETTYNLVSGAVENFVSVNKERLSTWNV